MVKLIAHGEAQETEICPNCHAAWRGEDIFETLRKQAWTANQSDAELHQYVQKFYSPPYTFSRVIGIEYDYSDWRHRDGVSAWQCPDCQHVFPRDLGDQTLTQEQVEWTKPSS